MTSLNPCFTVAFQLIETLALHEGGSRAGAARARAGAAARRRDPRRRAPPRRLPAPALGRHEPARDARDGDRLQPAPADRRRADHRARRDHPGADARAAAAAAARARHGAGADHARPRRRRRGRAARARDVRRPGGRDARPPPTCSSRRAIRTPRRCWPSLPEHNAGRRRLPRCAGVVPGAFDRPAGCLLSPRCRYVQRALPRRAAAAVRRSAPARRAASFR